MTPGSRTTTVIDDAYSRRPELTDRPPQNLDLTLFTDGSSLIQNGKRRARFVVTSEKHVVEAGVLPQGWSAQWAELWALIRALHYAADQQVNIYTNSK